jgi:cleavage and polyadenylation specificity factor subunit 3
MSVDTISFSAHADFEDTRDYIQKVLPPNIILVHGD